MKTRFALLLFISSSWLARTATIDRMTLVNYYSPYSGYTQGKLWLPSLAQTYYLSDSTSWGSGAGTQTLTGSAYVGATQVGGLIYYDFAPLLNNVLFSNTDYDSGSHSAQGTLGWFGDVILVAQAGGTNADFSGGTEILDNTETWYGTPRFNYYSASVGQSVYFEMDFVLHNSTWQLDTFSNAPNITANGFVDFTQVVPEPGVTTLLACGTGILYLANRKRRAV